jgi:hypothetical protein
MVDPIAERYSFDLQQGYRIGNAYATTIVGTSYLQPEYIFKNPERIIKCNVKQPLSATKNINPAVFPYGTQSDGINKDCRQLGKSKDFGRNVLGY